VDIGSTGVAVDRVGRRVYWTDAQRSIVRSAYDGSGEVSVIDFPATGAGTYIYGISLGR
jgi:DNA-binding beta-propeller fold protein YncE